MLDVGLLIPDPPAQILPDFSFTAEILVSEGEPTLLLAQAAINERSGTTMVLAPGAADESPVRTEVSTQAYGNGLVRVAVCIGSWRHRPGAGAPGCRG